MLQSRVLPGDDFVREYGGKVCAMPAPEVSIAIDVSACGDSTLNVLRRVVEHLKRGVTIVLSVSEQHRYVIVYRDDTAPRQFKFGQDVQVPDVLPGFEVPVARFFE